MKPIHHPPVPAQPATDTVPAVPAQLSTPVIRVRKCKARRGAIACGVEFRQFAMSDLGSFEDAAAHPDTVHWVPEHCGRCERRLLRESATAEQLAAQTQRVR